MPPSMEWHHTHPVVNKHNIVLLERVHGNSASAVNMVTVAVMMSSEIESIGTGVHYLMQHELVLAFTVKSHIASLVNPSTATDKELGRVNMTTNTCCI